MVRCSTDNAAQTVLYRIYGLWSGLRLFRITPHPCPNPKPKPKPKPMRKRKPKRKPEPKPKPKPISHARDDEGFYVKGNHIYIILYHILYAAF